MLKNGGSEFNEKFNKLFIKDQNDLNEKYDDVYYPKTKRKMNFDDS